ncbi:MAG: prepilin-type N-terminal cleavage/methylation domain-containing protein [Planctomycetota bacterium]|jgi:prepilin-type N-terminal cleavage/methylation domain-containing protein
MREKTGFTLVELLVVIVVIGILAALLLPAITKALCSGRQGATEHLVDNLTQATKNYEFDNAAYPLGDGTGSASLAAALAQDIGPKKLPYFEFLDGMLDMNGDVNNPVWPHSEIMCYRRNYPNPTAQAKNRTSFDIWGRDCNAVDPGNGIPTCDEANLVTNWD